MTKKMEIERCYFCETNLLLKPPHKINVDGKVYLSCESCMRSVHRILDLLQLETDLEIRRQVIKVQERFIEREIQRHIGERYVEGI